MNQMMQKMTKSKAAKKLYYVVSEKRRISLKNLLKKHYYIIRRQAPGGGFFSNWIWVAAHLCYAEKHGYMPVIDQQNYRTEYTEDKEINHTTNVWEYYFEQPRQTKLKEVYAGSNYILSDFAAHSDELPYSEPSVDQFLLDSEKLKHVHGIVVENIRLKQNVQDMLEERWRLIAGNGNRVTIGVHIRKTDKIVPPPGHYAAAGNDNYYTAIEKILQKHPDAVIFLCCDDQGTIELFRERYGSRVVYNEAYRAQAGSTVGIHLDKTYVRENHKYYLGLEVIMDTYMLARCDYLIHTHSNVTNAAIILNGGSYRERIFVG